MDQMIFGSVWISWIKGILSSASVSVLINGSPTAQFCVEKSVRQGDPLSSYLFILYIDGPIVAIKEVVDKGL